MRRYYTHTCMPSAESAQCTEHLALPNGHDSLPACLHKPSLRELLQATF